MSLKSWLYKRAVAYIGKCNQEWERPNIRHDLQNLDRLTYRNCDKAYLLYGSDAEWSKFSRYEVLDNAIQKLAMYEDRKELMPTKRRRLTEVIEPLVLEEEDYKNEPEKWNTIKELFGFGSGDKVSTIKANISSVEYFVEN